jgi:hypothetical protein
MPRESKLSINDESLLAAAIEGLEMQKARIESQIREIKDRLSDKAKPKVARPAAKATKRRNLRAAARKRISAAQKKRWEQYRKTTESKG